MNRTRARRRVPLVLLGAGLAASVAVAVALRLVLPTDLCSISLLVAAVLSGIVVVVVSAALVAMRRTAEEADMAAYVAATVHDLRTPLAGLQLAIEEAAACADARGAAVPLATAMRETAGLGFLIENRRLAHLLDRDERVQRRRRGDLARLLQAAVARSRPLARRLGVSLEAAVPDGPVEVDCAEDLAAQVLANLVHLAVRRGTRGNHVAVVLERTDAGFRVEVVDDAPGAPPGRIPTLDDSRRHSGSRLPAEVFTLAVCRHACGVLGWTLALEASTPAGVRAAVVGPGSDPT